MDKIRIDGIACLARVGISESERSAPQKVVVDILLSMDLEPASSCDTLTLSADYQELVERTINTVEKSNYRLLEALTAQLCRTVLSDSRIASVRVRVRKFPETLRGKADQVAIEMTRSNVKSLS